jgi:carboxymethylenebutenolidase
MVYLLLPVIGNTKPDAMRYLLFLGLTSLISGYAHSQCCSATRQFAALGAQPEFVDVHQEPAPFQLDNPQGMMVTFAAGDESNPGRAYRVGPDDASEHYLFVFHEWYGLNDHIKREADKLSEAFPGTIVLAIDLYDGKVAENREDASKYMKAMDDDRGLAIVRGAAAYAGEGARITTLGWCFGGAWSHRAAIELGEQAVACVIYYGMPEKSPEALERLHAPVLGIFATNDRRINEEVVGEFEAAMRDLGKEIETHWYEAGHGFANPSNQIFDEEATRDAWEKTMEFLGRFL